MTDPRMPAPSPFSLPGLVTSAFRPPQRAHRGRRQDRAVLGQGPQEPGGGGGAGQRGGGGGGV
jgi:hypothetical protein